MSAAPPDPLGIGDWEALSARLQALRAWSGLGYREVHRRLIEDRRRRRIREEPSYSTVFRCLQPGRSRVDQELVVDIAAVLLGDRPMAESWRQAWSVAAGHASAASVVSVSADLPSRPSPFVARDDETRRALAAVESTPERCVIAVNGMAGVGKTSFALHLAHEMARLRPFDVVLTAALRGSTTGTTPADPAAVLDGFLRRVGVPGRDVAGRNAEGRRALLHDVLGPRRVLVLLDDAASVEQVEPLLLDGNSITVLSSRRRLALPSASPVDLEVFSPDEALEMLRSRVGPRVDDEAGAASGIASLVGHLPLSLAVVGERMLLDEDWTIHDHLERLVARASRLQTDQAVEAALGASYDALPEAHQRLLRRLSIARDLTIDAAAALADEPREVVAVRLGDLTDARLVVERRPGRFDLHELVRLFAAARADDHDPPRARRTAVERLFGHYLTWARAAVAVYAPEEVTSGRGPLLPRHEPFTGYDDAVAWLEAERANMLAVAEQATADDRSDEVAHLASVLFRFLDNSAHFDDAERLHELATRASDADLRARAWTNLAVTAMSEGRNDVSLSRLDRAASAFHESEDAAGECRVRLIQGGTLVFMGRFAEALVSHGEAARIARELADQRREAAALGNIAVVHLLLGDLSRAEEMLVDALRLAIKIEDRSIETHAIIHLGVTYGRRGRHDEALELLEQGRHIAGEIGHRLAEIDVLNQIAIVHALAGQLDAALEMHELALVQARESGVAALEAQVLNSSGATLRAAGRVDEALARHQAALRLAERLDDRYQTAVARHGLGSSRADGGDLSAARTQWSAALDLHCEMGTPEAAELRHLLDTTPGPHPL